MRHLILFLLSLFIGFNVSPLNLSAQSEDPFPVTDGFIYDWDTEVIFPAGIYFMVKVYRPLAEIQNVTLTLQHGINAPIQITLDPAEGIALNDLETAYTYTWVLDTPLPILSDIVYSWQAQAVGSQYASLRDRIVFEDQRVGWQTSEVFPPRVRITTPVDGPRPEQVWEQIAPAYNLLTQNTERALSLDLMLYMDNLNATGCIQGTLPNGDSGLVAISPRHEIALPCKDNLWAYQTYYDGGFTLIETAANSAVGAHANIVLRLVADFYADSWTSANVPAWFQSGMAQFYVSGNKSVSLDPVRSTARTNRLLSLATLEDNAFTDTAARMQSYALVLYIADTIGVQGLFDLAKMEPDQNFITAYETAMGHALSTLPTYMSRWLFTERAVSAYEYDPYLSETSTPTATLTATASPTTTPSETANPTITPSVTGVHSPTPSNTPIPSATPIPPTATVTPRPAGSLFTPTAVPTSILDDPVGQQGVLAVVFIVLAIIGVTSIIIWRRND